MMNNPIMQIQQLMQAGKNPNAVLQMLAQISGRTGADGPEHGKGARHNH